VELLENQRLNVQLVALERRTSRVGKDTISHPPGGHDDVANAVAGALYLASAKRRGMPPITGEMLAVAARSPSPLDRLSLTQPAFFGGRTASR
jgi:hypothetical protein